MNLYERDYTKYLNDEERNAYEKELRVENRKGIKSNRDFPSLSHPDLAVRKFVRHRDSLFPNNYLDFVEFRDLCIDNEADEYHKIIYTAKKERDIQRYIKKNKKWFIPGSILYDFNTGNHDAYLFPEQKLGNDYIVDYMLIGKNSDGYKIILTEFENVNTSYCIETNNMESESVRKGLVQINDWQRWMDQNRDYFSNSLGLIQKGIEITTYNTFYCLVVSRRDLMDDRSRNIRNQKMFESHNLRIISYDRLEDNIRRMKR